MTNHVPSEALAVTSDYDVTVARRIVRDLAQAQGLRLVELTKLVTAVSELARNLVVHAGGGRMRVGQAADGSRAGVWAEFEDDGPGISDLDRALSDGFTSGGGLGLGLGGARRLVHEFEIRSTPGEGTWIRIVTWR